MEAEIERNGRLLIQSPVGPPHLVVAQNREKRN